MREEMEQEIDRVRRSFKAELVPYRASTELVRARDAAPGRHRIAVERVQRARGGPAPAEGPGAASSDAAAGGASDGAQPPA
jgi:hypothetical protein